MGSVKIHVLHCGEIGIPKPLLTNGQGWFGCAVTGLLTPERDRVWLPNAAYLIEHPRGLMLLDTGWPREISPHGIYDRSAQLRLLGAPLFQVCHGRVTPGQAVREQLEAHGIRPSDLDCVLLSHLDAPHVAALSSLRGAKRILVSEDDYFWSARANIRFVQGLFLPEPLERFWYRITHVGPEKQSFDLFGDGSVHLVHIPGHTEGLFATLLYSGDRYVLLNSDGAISPDSWKNMTVPGMAENAPRHLRSLRWIREMSASAHCVASLCSHDSDVSPQVIEF